MFDHFQRHEAVGEDLQAPDGRVVGRRLADEDRQVGFDAAVYLLVRAGLAYFWREQGQALIFKLLNFHGMQRKKEQKNENEQAEKVRLSVVKQQLFG